MADAKEANDVIQLKKTYNKESTDDCNEKIHSYMQELSGLVINARFQAREADIRAKYAIEFANQATAEAQSAHQVSGALARTSRMVASLALEFTNNFDDYFNDSRTTESIDSSFLESNISLQSGGDSFALSEGWSFDTVSSPDICDKDPIKDSQEPNETGQTLPDIQTTCPEGVSVDGLPIENPPSSMLCETGYAADATAQAADDKINSEQSLLEEMKNLEVKRKMQIYRDSKRVETKLNMPDSGHASLLCSEEKDSQIVANIPMEVACM